MCVLVFDIELMFILLLLKLFKLWYNYVTVQEDCYIGDLGRSFSGVLLAEKRSIDDLILNSGSGGGAAAAPVAVSAPAGSAGGVLLQLPLLLRKRRYTLL